MGELSQSLGPGPSVELLPAACWVAVNLARQPGWTYQRVADHLHWTPRQTLHAVRTGLQLLAGAETGPLPPLDGSVPATTHTGPTAGFSPDTMRGRGDMSPQRGSY